MVKFVLLRFQLHIKQSNFDYNKKNQAFGLGFFVDFASLRRFALLSDFTYLIVA